MTASRNHLNALAVSIGYALGHIVIPAHLHIIPLIEWHVR